MKQWFSDFHYQFKKIYLVCSSSSYMSIIVKLKECDFSKWN